SSELIANLLCRNDQSRGRLRGHLEKIRGTASFDTVNYIDCATLVHAEPAIDPGQERRLATHRQQGRDKRLSVGMILLLDGCPFDGIGMLSLVLDREADGSFIRKHVDVYSLFQSGLDYSESRSRVGGFIGRIHQGYRQFSYGHHSLLLDLAELGLAVVFFGGLFCVFVLGVLFSLCYLGLDPPCLLCWAGR